MDSPATVFNYGDDLLILAKRRPAFIKRVHLENIHIVKAKYVDRAEFLGMSLTIKNGRDQAAREESHRVVEAERGECNDLRSK